MQRKVCLEESISIGSNLFVCPVEALSIYLFTEKTQKRKEKLVMYLFHQTLEDSSLCIILTIKRISALINLFLHSITFLYVSRMNKKCTQELISSLIVVFGSFGVSLVIERLGGSRVFWEYALARL